MSEMIAYLITLNRTKKQYVGITKYSTPDNRIERHKKSDYLIGRAIRKHGILKVSIIAVTQNWNELCKLEKELIILHNTRKPHGYNLTDGGEGTIGFRHTVAFKKAAKERATGNKYCLGRVLSSKSLTKITLHNSNPKKALIVSKALKKKWEDPVWATKMRKILQANSEKLVYERKRTKTTNNKSIEAIARHSS